MLLTDQVKLVLKNDQAIYPHKRYELEEGEYGDMVRAKSDWSVFKSV